MNTTIRRLACLLVCLGWVTAAGSARGQDASPVPKPTAEHERLAKDVGTWDATVKSWMTGPDSEPAVSKGVEVVKMMPGGLWAQSEFDGKIGDIEFHGCGLTGYDTRKEKYVCTWVDTTSTELTVMEGDVDATSHTMTLHTKGTDPSGKAYAAKLTSKYEGDGTRVGTLSMKSNETKGEYVKKLEITYKRRAK